ncbi:Root meristem growth factor 9 [Quillaja saponaria]|uniref:Root meristem growth factor 9 n=1 Tax=Quillaja saponaria TaxID=32244 RepID=A0AAD7KUS2_QUISA|nr:Root meristem growth factor 9 [Quillaja saponaria]
MAMVPAGRHLILVAFFLLCFISITARGRSLRETTSTDHDQAEQDSNNLYETNQGKELDSNDLVSVDYTEAKRNPPINN